MRPPATTAALGLIAVTLALGGCGTTDPSRPAASGTSTPVAAPTTSPPPPAAPPTAAVAAPSVTSDDRVRQPEGALSVPAETAGDLDSSDVPGPPDLGPGWKRYVDPGEAEDGYVGNGSWVRARGSKEVVQAVVPLGCAGLTALPRLPVPLHALEATYRGPGGAPAVALVFDYTRISQARSFVEMLGEVGRACPEPARPVRRNDPMVAVVDQVAADSTTILDRRREYGVGASEWVWSEVVVRRGVRVGLLTVASAPNDGAPDLAGLARSVRASIDR